MNLQDYKEIHRDKSAVQKLGLLVITMNMMGSCRVNYSTCANPESRAYSQSELDGQRERAEWLYEEIKTALTAQNADSSAKAAESVAIAANAVVSGENDKMDVE